MPRCSFNFSKFILQYAIEDGIPDPVQTALSSVRQPRVLLLQPHHGRSGHLPPAAALSHVAADGAEPDAEAVRAQMHLSQGRGAVAPSLPGCR